MQRHIIRTLTSEDWDAWWQLRLRALADYPDAFGQDHDDVVAEGEHVHHERYETSPDAIRSRIFGAFNAKGVLVGVASIAGNDRRKMRHRMDVWDVYVAPAARRASLALRLLDAYLTFAQGTGGVRQVHLTVSSHNHDAVRLYEQLGFTRYGRDPRALVLWDGREVDEDLMVLLLDT